MAQVYFPIALHRYLPEHPVPLAAEQVLEQLLLQLGQQNSTLQQALWLEGQLHPTLYLFLNQQQCHWAQIKQRQLSELDQLMIVQPLSGG